MAQDFHDLVVWQRAMEMTVSIYRFTQSLPREELYGLSSQMRRAAVSVASNIAEGRGRLTEGEFRQFLGLSPGIELRAPNPDSRRQAFGNGQSGTFKRSTQSQH
jgi:hypothetical protein